MNLSATMQIDLKLTLRNKYTFHLRWGSILIDRVKIKLYNK